MCTVANGPKDHIAEQEDFESWRSTQQHHQGYTTPISTTSDPYTMSNYYNTGFTGDLKSFLGIKLFFFLL